MSLGCPLRKMQHFGYL